MYGRKNRGKRGFRRAVVTLLTFVMLVSTCFPSLVANAAEESEIAVAAAESQEITAGAATQESQSLTAEGEAEPNGAGSQPPEDGTTSQGTEEQAGSEESQSQTTEETPESNGTESQNTEDGTKSEGTEEQTESEESQTTEDETESNGTGSESQNTEDGTESKETEGQTTSTTPSISTGDSEDSDNAATTVQAYQARLDALSERINALNQMDDTSEEYKAELENIGEALDALEGELGHALSTGTITVDEHTALFARHNEICDALYGEGSEGGDIALYADNPNMKYYNADNNVAYDVARSNNYGYNDTSLKYVKKVTLGGVGVLQGNSNESYGKDTTWFETSDNRIGQKLSVYYPGLNTNSQSGNKTLVITPADGYYVTQVTVACCDGGAPYRCGTWAQEKEFTRTFNVSAGGDLTMELPSYAFAHGSSSSHESQNGEEQYFILIKVAPVPTPLYVGYDYGIIGGILGSDLNNTDFADPSKWTTASGNNNYGTGGDIATRNTLYRYQYDSSNPSEVSEWKHYANLVSDGAKQAAAEKGYYFTGWNAYYYMNYNSTTKEFSNAYSTYPTPYSEGETVNLITNVKLVAQWAPVELSVKKVVSGLESSFLTAHTYGLTVYYKATEDAAWPETGEEVSLTVTGNGEASAVAISPARPGYYMVKETSGNENLTNGSTTMYIAVTDGGEVNISPSDIVGGTTSATLTVTNSYSSATPKIKLVKKWLDANGNELTGEATANLPKVTFHLNDADGAMLEETTVNYEGSWTTTCEMPENFAGVTEVVPSGYKQRGEISVSTENDLENKIVYTVYTATNQQDTTSITVTKQVTGNMGDVNKEFNFTATLSGGTMTPGTYTGYTVANDGVTITFTLKDNGTVTISNVPISAALTLKESNVSAYEVSIDGTVVKQKDQGGDATSSEITVAPDLTIAVVNKNEALIDTGISMPTFPFILLFSTVAVLGSVYLIGKRRYGEF